MIILILFLSLNASGQVEKLQAALAKHPEQMSIRLQLAQTFQKAQKYDETIALLNPYTDQLNIIGFLTLATAYSKKEDYRNEVRVLSFLVNKDEENFRWYMLLAQAHLKLAWHTKDQEGKKNQLTFGIQKLRRALAIKSGYKPAYDLLLNTLLQQRANNEARELILEGIERFGQRPELFREMCRLDSQDGFLVQAVEHCEASIKISPNYPDHYVYYIQSLSDQKEDQKAERVAIKAARQFPQSEFVQWAAGMLFYRKKNFPVAARYFQTAANANPESARTQFGLAQSLFESGNEAEALKSFIKACKMDRSTIDAFLAAGGRLRQRGDSKLGRQYSQAAATCR